MEKTEKVLSEVLHERLNQEKRWGQQNHNPFVWATILGEEVGEVSKAIQECYFRRASWLEYRQELIQVAAVAVAMVESFDRNGGFHE